MQMTFIINSQNPETLKILLQLQGGDNWSYWEQQREKKGSSLFYLVFLTFVP